MSSATMATGTRSSPGTDFEDRQCQLPADLEVHMRESLFHMFDSCSSELQRLKSKAVLNARALKRQESADPAAEVEHRNEILTEELKRLKGAVAITRSGPKTLPEASEDSGWHPEASKALPKASGDTRAEASLQDLLLAAEELYEERSREMSMLQEKLSQRSSMSRDEEMLRDLCKEGVKVEFPELIVQAVLHEVQA